MADPRKVETPQQDLTTAQAIALLAEKLKPQGPLEMAGLSPERIAEITQLPKPQRYRDIPFRSEETGATAVAHVVESRDKRYPHGRIVQLFGYTHPSDAYIYEKDGGRVPDGFPMWANGRQITVPEGQEPQQGDLSQAFLQWRYETFYKTDLARYVGKGFQPGYCAEPDGIKTPWIESKVGAISDAA